MQNDASKQQCVLNLQVIASEYTLYTASFKSEIVINKCTIST